MVNHNIETSHDRHREVSHGADRTAHAARHEATSGLLHSGTDHKNLSKLPSNKASEHALHDLHIHDPHKGAEKPAKGPTPERKAADHIVSDLQKPANEGQLSKETTQEIENLARKEYAKSGMDGVDKLGDKINSGMQDAQQEAQVPGWQKRFSFGNSTGTWRDFSLSNGSTKDTAGVELVK